MKWTLLPLLGLAAAASAESDPSGAVADIKAKGEPPEGCSADFQGRFMMTSKTPGAGNRAFISETVMCGGKETLVMTLENSVLRDSEGRIGYIANNFQLQFDGPPQAGATITSGFYLCENGSLALGSSAFYGCVSGNFSNQYNKNWAEQCSGNELVAIPCDNEATADWSDDAVPVCQIDDGQIQAHTTPCETPPPRSTSVPPLVETTSVQSTLEPPTPFKVTPPGPSPKGVTPSPSPPPAPKVPSNTTQPSSQASQQPSKPAASPVTPSSPTRSAGPGQAPATPQATTPAPTAGAVQSLPGTAVLFVAALGAALCLY